MNQQYKEKYTTSIKRNAVVSYTSLFDEKELVVAFREREIFIFMFLRRVSTSYFCNASTVFCWEVAGKGPLKYHAILMGLTK